MCICSVSLFFLSLSSLLFHNAFQKTARSCRGKLCVSISELMLDSHTHFESELVLRASPRDLCCSRVSCPECCGKLPNFFVASTTRQTVILVCTECTVRGMETLVLRMVGSWHDGSLTERHCGARACSAPSLLLALLPTICSLMPCADLTSITHISIVSCRRFLVQSR